MEETRKFILCSSPTVSLAQEYERDIKPSLNNNKPINSYYRCCENDFTLWGSKRHYLTVGSVTSFVEGLDTADVTGVELQSIDSIAGLTTAIHFL